MEKRLSEGSRLKSLKSFKPAPISLPEGELVKMHTLDQGQTLPLVIEPAVENVDLAEWVRGNQQLIQDKLLKHGAILFRGFETETAAAFEDVAHGVCRTLFSENGEHPRKSVSGQVYTPVFYPSDKHLLWHNENSFNEMWPTKIMFGCLKPAARGGETPIVDSREVFRALPIEIRDPFIEKQVMYQRNYSEHMGLNWQTVFRTTSKVEVERYCEEHGFTAEWKKDGGLRTRCVRPAAIEHPQTGEMSWFNQAQHWHISCLDPDVREAIVNSFSEEDLPRNCYYGDGSRIEDSVMQAILDVYRRLEVSFAWQARDIMLLDNVLTAHARNQFEGERKMLVAMGDMTSYRALKALNG